MGNSLRKIALAFVAVIAVLANVANAEERIISVVGRYVAGAEESLNDAKQHALEDAMRQAAEQAGVMVTSYSKTHNLMLTDDEVTTMTAKIMRVTEKSFDVKTTETEISVAVKLTAIVNTDSLDMDVVRVREENAKLKSEKSALANDKDAMLKLDEDMRQMRRHIENRYVPGGAREPFHSDLQTPVWRSWRNQFLTDMSKKYYFDPQGDKLFGASGWILGALYSYLDSKGIDNKKFFADTSIDDPEIISLTIMAGEAIYMAQQYLSPAYEFFTSAHYKLLSHPNAAIDPTLRTDLDYYCEIMNRWHRFYGQTDKAEVNEYLKHTQN